MESLKTSSSEHILNDKWNLYYHLPNNNNWDLSSYEIIMNDINTVEDVASLNNAISDNVIRNCMLFVMRKGITPVWEDPRNRNGGCFSYKILNKFVSNVWRQLFSLLCNETLSTVKEANSHINGITISPKKNFCIVKIWFDISNYQDPNIITAIQNLSSTGCLFKKHEPEF
jgi:hypothetical protein